MVEKVHPHLQITKTLTFFERLFPKQSERVHVLLGGEHNYKKLWNSISLILGRFTSSGLGFLTWLITVRIYSPEEVGIASGVISAVMLVVQISLIGLNSAFISLYPKYRKEPSKLLNTAFNLIIVTSSITAAVFILLSSTLFQHLNIVSDSLFYILLFFGLSILATLNTLLDHISIGIRESEQVLVRNLLFGLLTITSVVVIPGFTQKAVSSAVITSWVIASFAGCGLGLYQIYKSIAKYQYQFEVDLKISKQLIRQGFQNYLLTLGERAPNWVIPIVVIEILSPEENAYWYTLWMMVWVIYNIPISVGQNLFADISQKVEDLRKSIFFSIKTSIIFTTLGGAIAIILAHFMLSLMGSAYAEFGTVPLRILLLGALPIVFIQTYYGVCRGIGKLTEATITGWASGTMNVAAVFIVGENFGLVGLAVSLVSIQVLLGAWSLLRVYQINRLNET